MSATFEVFLDRYRLWSFADMIDCKVICLTSAHEQLAAMIHSLYRYPDMRAEMLPDAKKEIAQNGAWFYLEQSGFPITDQDFIFRIWALRGSLEGNNPFSAESVAHALEGLRNQFVTILSAHKFAYIPSEVQCYFEQEQLFGGIVYEFFPEARKDIKDAGNCIAAELYTASVFHLMRVAEYGLRSLARRLKVTLTHKGKPQPIDTATWDKVINAVRSKHQAAHNLHYGNRKRAEKLHLYADLLDRCVALKDLYRNDVMHNRAIFGYHDAMGVFERVKGFMQALSRP